MPGHLVRFADFEVDLRSRELRRAGQRVRLQDQPFQILAILLDRAGDVVPREDIQGRLWPDGTFVDFEHSVNAAVKRLRATLGDTADNPRFIETLHRRGYRFIGTIEGRDGVEELAAPAVIPKTTDHRPRLVVLPFSNLSGGHEEDYFSDGLTEEMIAQVGRRCANRIGVLARTSSMLYKNVVRAASEIGEALRADYLVEGSVRREGDRVRITAQLIETKGETHLWAESYDRQLADCIAVQAEVASQIAQALALELLPATAVARSGTRNTAAYQTFLRGRFFWNKPGDIGLEEAIGYYDQAVALDPSFGRAYSARARARIALCEYHRVDPAVVLDRIRADASRALTLDPGDSDAHVALGESYRVFDWDSGRAEACYRAALDVNPNSESAHRYYGLFLVARGRNEALAIADRGWDLDPLCLTNNTAAATVRFFGGDYEGAAGRCRHTLEMEPSHRGARRLLAASLAALRRYDDALDEFTVLTDYQPADLVSRAWMANTLALSGNRAAAQAVTNALQSAASGQPTPPFHLALAWVGLGDRDAAFRSLDAACAAHDPSLDTLDVEPRFLALRGDRRYPGFVDRLGLRATV